MKKHGHYYHSKDLGLCLVSKFMFCKSAAAPAVEFQRAKLEQVVLSSAHFIWSSSLCS